MIRFITIPVMQESARQEGNTKKSQNKKDDKKTNEDIDSETSKWNDILFHCSHLSCRILCRQNKKVREATTTFNILHMGYLIISEGSRLNDKKCATSWPCCPLFQLLHLLLMHFSPSVVCWSIMSRIKEKIIITYLLINLPCAINWQMAKFTVSSKL